MTNPRDVHVMPKLSQGLGWKIGATWNFGGRFCTPDLRLAPKFHDNSLVSSPTSQNLLALKLRFHEMSGLSGESSGAGEGAGAGREAQPGRPAGSRPAGSAVGSRRWSTESLGGVVPGTVARTWGRTKSGQPRRPRRRTSRHSRANLGGEPLPL